MLNVFVLARLILAIGQSGLKLDCFVKRLKESKSAMSFKCIIIIIDEYINLLLFLNVFARLRQLQY